MKMLLLFFVLQVNVLIYVQNVASNTCGAAASNYTGAYTQVGNNVHHIP